MHFTKIYSLLLILIVLSSCYSKSENPQKDRPVFDIQIRIALQQKDEPVNLSDIAGKISYIPLETNVNCLLSTISRLYLTSNYIFIYDSKSLFQFDRSGKFIRKIGNNGAGPGEYGNRIKYTIDEENKKAIVYSYPDRLNIYNIENGNFEKSFNTNFPVADLAVFPNKGILFFTQDLPGIMLDALVNEIIVTDYSGSIIDSVVDYNRLNNKNMFAGYVNLYDFEQKLSFMGLYKDTLYTIDESLQKRLRAVFHFKNKISLEGLNITPEMADELADYINAFKLMENDEYFFLTIQIGIPAAGGRRLKNMIFNKNSNKIIPLTEINNNIDGGLPFWPEFVFGNKLIDYFHAYELQDYSKSVDDKNIFKGEIREILQQINENDNPILVIAER